VIVGVPKESYPGERRVALVPAVIPTLAKAGLEVVVESSAGNQAGYPDSAYVEKGGKILSDRAAVFAAADIIVQVLCYGSNDVTGKADLPLMRSGQLMVGFLRPFGSAEVIQQIAAAGVTSFSVELVPRTTRAQSMDALSSMGTICGYKAVLLAAETSIRIFPMMTTAAGTITPARVFVIGAGVAGLQAISTARRLGAVASAYDMRAASKAAVIPGKKSPVLITAEMVRGMAPGSVIVDLASERGGNCELTRTGETVKAFGVTIIGAINLASSVPYNASQMYARNIATFLAYIVKDGKLQLNEQDEIIRETMVTRNGEVVNARVREFFKLPAFALQ
jgi:NAD(P) transhydrogenase subunit alpha